MADVTWATNVINHWRFLGDAETTTARRSDHLGDKATGSADLFFHFLFFRSQIIFPQWPPAFSSIVNSLLVYFNVNRVERKRVRVL